MKCKRLVLFGSMNYEQLHLKRKMIDFIKFTLRSKVKRVHNKFIFKNNKRYKTQICQLLFTAMNEISVKSVRREKKETQINRYLLWLIYPGLGVPRIFSVVVSRTVMVTWRPGFCPSGVLGLFFFSNRNSNRLAIKKHKQTDKYSRIW